MHRAKSRKKPGANVQLSSYSGVTWICLIIPVTMCDNVCGVFLTRKACLKLGVQDFSWGSQQLHDWLDYTNSSPSRQNKVFTIIHIVNKNYLIKLVLWDPRSPYKNPYQAEHSKGLEKSSPRIRPRANHEDKSFCEILWLARLALSCTLSNLFYKSLIIFIQKPELAEIQNQRKLQINFPHNPRSKNI